MECFTSGGDPLMFIGMRSWMGPRAILDALLKRHIPASSGINTKFSCSIQFLRFQSAARGYTLLKMLFHFFILHFSLVCVCQNNSFFYRFEIEKKLRLAKKQEMRKKRDQEKKREEKMDAKERSKERKKTVEENRGRVDKKAAAMNMLKARREERRERGTCMQYVDVVAILPGHGHCQPHSKNGI